MRSAELTRQLLAFSRQQVLEPRVVDLNEIVSTIERMLRRVIGADIAFSMEKETDLGRVKVDPGQIEQVLLNLVVNARDAMPNGGNLTIATANEQVAEGLFPEHPQMQPGAYVRLSVSDDGTGMSKDVQSRVFEPFFTTKDVGKGTVFGIVRQSGGIIHLTSEVGRGTTFDVYLPRSEEAPVSIVAPAQTSELHGTETVLLVEDEPTVRRAIATVLRKYGYKVLESANPINALELCETDQHVDLLVTDVMMPGMSGRDLAGQVGRLRPSLPVLYTSGHTEVRAASGATKRGTLFLQKPFTTDALARKVREALKR
jgi:CheY-like chemotaxis protein